MGIRDDFYKGLRAEYAQDPDSSFLFRFLKNEHRTDCDQMSVDDLLGRLANRNLTLNLPEAGREWLCALGERAGGAQLRETLEHTPGERKQSQLIQEALRKQPEVVHEEDLACLRGLVLDAQTRQRARAFLDDAEFPLEDMRKEVPFEIVGGGDDEEENDAQKKKPRKAKDNAKSGKTKKDRMMNMLDDWGRETHYCLCPERASGSNGLTDEERKAWNEMFRLLQDMDDTTGIILPVRVDTLTGAGLYLAGVDCYLRREAERMKDKETKVQYKCVFVCLIPSEIPNPDYHHGFYLYLTPYGDDTVFCVSLADGEKMFSAIQKSRMVYDFFWQVNGIAPSIQKAGTVVRSTPEQLRDYFFQAKETHAVLVEEGRLESERDRKNNLTFWAKRAGRE